MAHNVTNGTSFIKNDRHIFTHPKKCEYKYDVIAHAKYDMQQAIHSAQDV